MMNTIALTSSLLLPIAEENLYPLLEIARIEESDVFTITKNALVEWVKQRSVALYAEGRLTLSRLAEILNISLWEAMELVQKQRVPLQMGRMNK